MIARGVLSNLQTLCIISFAYNDSVEKAATTFFLKNWLCNQISYDFDSM